METRRIVKYLVIVFLLPFLGLLAFLIWKWLSQRYAEGEMEGFETQAEIPIEIAGEALPLSEIAKLSQDDLTEIRGIGPKTCEALQAAGIVTFAQLAQTDLNHLQDILKKAGLRVAVSESWLEQARLTVMGRWDEFEALYTKNK